ncbi:trypsin-like serine protease [Amycolatopsis sp. cmx-4-68]|uniref:trypsin-like serine protease n=1 Tax=Amycolatopsis sp. cmx-4-68 TaxID=2790938 RepID=UPI00397B35C2
MLAKLLIRSAVRAHGKAMLKLETAPHLAEELTPTPWVVEIAYDAEKHGDMDHMDAVGVLVSDRHVLTCAHTFRDGRETPLNDKQYFVRVGSDKLGQGRRCSIERIIVHPDFKAITPGQRRPSGRNSDLAILVLSEPADVEPVTIVDGHPLKFYSSVTVFGWPLGGEGTGNLHQVNTAVLPFTCGMVGGISPGEMALANFAGAGQLGGGYSGGPVVLFPEGQQGTPRLVGLVSRGALGMPTQDSYGPPGIATDLTHQRGWISETVRS